MKSYLRFLSRYKLYTAIEVVGLCDSKIKNADDICLVLPDDSMFYRPEPISIILNM